MGYLLHLISEPVTSPTPLSHTTDQIKPITKKLTLTLISNPSQQEADQFNGCTLMILAMLYGC